MIDGLIRALKATIPDCTAEHVADALWLAALAVDLGTPDDATATAPEAADDNPAAAGPPIDPATEQRPAHVSPPGSEPAAANTGTVPATAVGLRAPSSLERPELTARALRSFRRVHRPGRPVVDVDATVEATADAGRLVVITNPARDRGLDVAIVVDRSPVTALWADSIAEFVELVRRVGAFRQVTRWTLLPGHDATGAPTLLVHDALGTPHEPDRLVDPTGRQLVLVITDAVADHWYAPPLWTAMRRWAHTMPTAIVSLLPENHWGFAALGRPSATIRSRRPAGPNSSAEVRAAWWEPEEVANHSTPLPVVAMHHDALNRWARAVATGGAWIDAVWTEQPHRRPGGEANASLSAHDRLRAFRSRASAQAQALARILAGAPVLSLPLIRVLQQRLLLSTDPTPLAEIMVSGLLERLPAGADDRYTWLRFRPGIAEPLQRGATTTQEWDTFEVLSEYLERHAGSGGDVRALLFDPHGTSYIDPGLEPFAAMGQQVARRLGIEPPSPGPQAAPSAEGIVANQRRYAHVVIVGDAGAGKSTLARALIGSTGSNTLDVRVVPDAHGRTETREVLLWDLPVGSEPRPRLRDASVVLVVEARDCPSAQLVHWAELIDAASPGAPPVKFLVPTRTDSRPFDGITTDFGFAGCIRADALTGVGMAELRAVVLAAIDWEALPVRVTPPEYDSVLDFLDQRRHAGALIAGLPELVDQYLAVRGDAIAPEVVTAVLTAEQSVGRTVFLSAQDMWLLQPILLERCIAAIANATPHDLGYIDLDEALARLYEALFPPHVARHRVLLAAAVDELVASGAALRVVTDRGVVLALPERLRVSDEYPGGHRNTDEFAFAGPTRPVLSAVAARLANASGFRLHRMYRDAAEFRDPDGRACGFKVHEPSRLTAFVNPEHRDAFLAIVQDQLARQLPDPVTHEQIRSCPACQTELPVSLVSRTAATGRPSLTCPNCAAELPVADLIAGVKELLRHLSSSETDVRRAAVVALAQHTRSPAAHAAVAERAAEDFDPLVRVAATRALREFARLPDPEGREFVPLLMHRARQDPYGEVRLAAVAALGDHAANPAVSAALGELATGDAAAEVRAMAASGIATTGHPAYREVIRDIAPRELLGRQEEIAELAAFCLSPTGPSYQWWQGAPWSGKTALMAWFALHPPPGVNVVSCFATGHAGLRNFIGTVQEQLARLTGRPVPPVISDTHFIELLHAAADQCQRQGRRLVLLVDGLDEDRWTPARAPSIASLLPRHPPAGMRVIVAGRPDPPLPSDATADHPLRDPANVRILRPFDAPPGIRDAARRELGILLNLVPEQDVLGLLTVSGGGLTAEDLAELTGRAPWQIGQLLDSFAGRTFSRRREGSAYQWAHEALADEAATVLGSARISAARKQVGKWANGYAKRGWPPETPGYLLHRYFAYVTDNDGPEAMVALATDDRRRERLLDQPGGQPTAVREVTSAYRAVLSQEELDRKLLHRLHPALDAAEAVVHGIGDVALITEVAVARLANGELARSVALIATIEEPDARAHALSELPAAMELGLRVHTLTVADTLRWLRVHGTDEATGYLLESLCRQQLDPDDSASVVAASLAWLRLHGTDEATGHLLGSLCRQQLDPDDSASVVAASLAWLQLHGTDVDAQFVLTALTGRELDPQRASVVTAAAIAWLDAHHERRDSQFLLMRLLLGRQLPPEQRAALTQYARSWLDRYGTTADAAFVRDVLDRSQHPDG